MAEFGWIKLSVLLITVPQMTVAGPRRAFYFTASEGDTAALPCGHVRKAKSRCDGATWLLLCSGNAAAAEQSTAKKAEEASRAKADRLSITVNCSLVIKNITAEDAGLYICLGHKLSQQQGHGSRVYLFVNGTATKHKVGEKAKSNCSVCRPDTVKTLPEGGGKGANSGSPRVSCWWGYVLAAVALAALVVTAAIILRWTRSTANDTHVDDNTAGPEEGVSYASISYTKKTDSTAQFLGKDVGDVVTYSTVKASSSSADPTDLYASINKPKK